MPYSNKEEQAVLDQDLAGLIASGKTEKVSYVLEHIHDENLTADHLKAAIKGGDNSSVTEIANRLDLCELNKLPEVFAEMKKENKLMGSANDIAIKRISELVEKKSEPVSHEVENTSVSNVSPAVEQSGQKR